MENHLGSMTAQPARPHAMQELAFHLSTDSEEPPLTWREQPASAGQERQSAAQRTVILAPSACLQHLTAPEPYSRSAPELPPENVARLHVLTHPGLNLASLHCFLLLHGAWHTPVGFTGNNAMFASQVSRHAASLAPPEYNSSCFVLLDFAGATILYRKNMFIARTGLLRQNMQLSALYRMVHRARCAPSSGVCQRLLGHIGLTSEDRRRATCARLAVPSSLAGTVTHLQALHSDLLTLLTIEN